MLAFEKRRCYVCGARADEGCCGGVDGERAECPYGLVMPPPPERWAPRDASWLNRPGIGGRPPRWHLVGHDESPACGYPTLLAIDLHNGGRQPPAESLKCARCLAWLKRHNARLTAPDTAHRSNDE